MKRLYPVFIAVPLFVAGYGQETAPLKLVQTIPLAGVKGRIDHMAVDVQAKRLFVAALGNDTVEVLDLQTGKRLHTIAGLQEPQGIRYVPEIDRIFVASGGDGTCKIFDGRSYQPAGRVNFSSDADNVRYDPVLTRIYVGYGGGALGIVDAAKGTLLGEIKLEGHPESFQLETSGRKIFVNVPTRQHIAVVDREKHAVVAKWPVSAQANFPMALDERNQRLFIGCRHPAKLLVLDAQSGKMISELTIPGDTDDLFYDASRRRIYVSCGEGFLAVLEQKDANHYQPSGKIPTAPGARTSLFVPEMSHLYLAVPRRANQEAEIRVYNAK
ncbi:MAG TPA: hypothetical protein VGL91_00090 [Acidobacteriota bacterium]|jgi:WD40 repeat protein